jgi:hypothetical protein
VMAGGRGRRGRLGRVVALGGHGRTIRTTR